MTGSFVANRLRPLVNMSGFLRKEMTTVIRQPRFLVVLVVGPFILLLAFAVGYDPEQTVLRTLLVGPPDAAYRRAVESITGDLRAYITLDSYTSDRRLAEERLARGEVDLVVVFPSEPTAAILDGEQAVIIVIHDKLDPIQQTAVEVSSEVAVQELNAVVLETIVADFQEELGSLLEEPGLPAGGAYRERLVTTDPRVVVRPFTAEVERIADMPVSVGDFFAPAAVALLVQHMALTFSAMSLVRDRDHGLFELFRVGSIGPGRILAGKYLAHLMISSALAAALIASVTMGVGVPFRGQVWWAAIGMVGLVAASTTAGTGLALVARTPTQAVQYAMLLLLAGLFFGGFLLDLDAVRYPFKAISLILPVTFGTRLLRDVLLRGVAPDPVDVVALALISVVMAGASWLLLARRLRLE